MKTFIISDTHNKHKETFFDQTADLLIHTGDFLGENKKQEKQFKDFTDFIKDLDYDNKIIIPGNHDYFVIQNPNRAKEICENKNINLLINEYIEIEDILFYGLGFVENKKKSNKLEYFNKYKERYDIIDNCDCLLTHIPPYQILDINFKESNEGSELLRKTINKIQPKYHFFGHIHEARGILKNNKTTFINSSTKGYLIDLT